MPKKIGAWFLIGFGLFMLLGLLVGESAGFIAMALSFALFVIGPIAGGILLLRGDRKARERAAIETQKVLQQAHEKEILRLAEQKRGLLTVSQIVKETSMNASEAEAALHELIVKRLVDMRSGIDGQVVYEFPEFAGPDDLDRRRLESELHREQ
jgi:hypothetical protein